MKVLFFTFHYMITMCFSLLFTIWLPCAFLYLSQYDYHVLFFTYHCMITMCFSLLITVWLPCAFCLLSTIWLPYTFLYLLLYDYRVLLFTYYHLLVTMRLPCDYHINSHIMSELFCIPLPYFFYSILRNISHIFSILFRILLHTISHTISQLLLLTTRKKR